MADTFLSGFKWNRRKDTFACFLATVVFIVGPISCQLHDESFPESPRDYETGRRLTREYRLKQGPVKGLILETGARGDLGNVEVFLGLPYAAPPVEYMRFMPPGSATHWSELKLATNFAPVCPQMLPELKKDSFSAGRSNYMKRLLPFLRNQSEDCLYLNVYVPSNEGYSSYNRKKYPVMVFIHGESFEWNSGNPYDGTVLAAYGQIIVVTINFRLGILGFMKPSVSTQTLGNFGLLDQVAALQWVKDNIETFNGDPNSVTLAGHDTGAGCVNFLMVSPVANGLFHRAILMSGSALSDWALTSEPRQFTVQVAHSLNCPVHDDDLVECLRKKSLSEIMAVRVASPKYVTPFGPIVDGSVIPNEPAKVMSVYRALFSKYELLYGCTELEAYHLLGAIALAHGLLKSERDSLLRDYAQTRFQHRPDLVVATTLKEYSSFDIDPARSAADTHRDSLLDILGDATVTAPLVQTANFHSKANPKSYFYVFGHNSEAGEYAALAKSVHGEELAYMFGVPLGASKNHFREGYTPQERLFSEIVMTFWTNFAKTGNPNTPSRTAFKNLGPKDWDIYDIEWPKYTVENQSYIHIGIPPHLGSHFRQRYMRYWNEGLPDMLKNITSNPQVIYESPSAKYPNKASVGRHFGVAQDWNGNNLPSKIPHYPESRFPPRRENDRHDAYNPFIRPTGEIKPTTENIFAIIRKMDKPNRPMPPGLFDESSWRKPQYKNPQVVSSFTTPTPPLVGKTVTETPILKSSVNMNLVIGIGVAFLLINVFAFALLYYKKSRLKSREREIKRASTSANGEIPDGENNVYEKGIKDEVDTNSKGCNVFGVIKPNTKSDDFYEPVKNHVYDGSKTPKSDDSGGFGQRFKLRRQMSSSTIDAQTKVRDWIAHEIVQRCSPRFLRRNEDAKQEQKIVSNGTVIHIPIRKNPGDEVDCLDMPKPNCQIGSLTGSLRATTDSTASVGAQEKQMKLFNQNSSKNIMMDPKDNTGSAKSSKPSNKSTSNKSSKSKKSNDKAGLDGSLRKKEKPHKVSVAIDATPATRSSSVLKQEPIELSKSMDFCWYDDSSIPERCGSPLRRSQTVEDFIRRSSQESLNSSKENVFKSTVNLKVTVGEQAEKPSEVIKIVHKHSVSDPVKDINYGEMFPYGLKNPKHPGSFHTFSTIQPPVAFRNDINVTSRDEMGNKPMSSAEALMTIKRRNYPKVLPDLPKPGEFMPTMAQKRLSLPPQNNLLFLPTSEESSLSNSEASSPTEIKSFRGPPLPPPRGSSTLGRKPSFPDGRPQLERMNSYDRSRTLSHHPAHNNNYVQMFSNTLPLRMASVSEDTMPYYSQIQPKSRPKVNMMELEMSDVSQSDQSESEREDDYSKGSGSFYEPIKPQPRMIISANPNTASVIVNDAKVIIKPALSKKPSNTKQTNIPRVLIRDDSFDKDERKSRPNLQQSNASSKASLIHDTVDTKLVNLMRPADLKIEIPVYVPDTKGPPTQEELQRRTISDQTHKEPQSKQNSLSRSVSRDKADPLKDDKKNPKQGKSISRSGSNSRIPKTPTMATKSSKKEPPKVHSSPKPIKGRIPGKNIPPKGSSIPHLVPSLKTTTALSDKENSNSESSADTETSIDTVKKIR